MAAQHQHYVPRHLLRGFLSNRASEARKEQVRVLDLDTGATFTTKIDNIMGERRYNEWRINDDYLATMEPGIGKVEELVFPVIESIRSRGGLDRTPEQHSLIALLFALQFLRAKKVRLLPERFDEQLSRHLAKMGATLEQVEGWRPSTEETLKAQHAKFQARNLQEFTEIMAEKEFFVARAPEGKSLYISDAPVVMHNDEKTNGLMGNLGLQVPYIQLYLPIRHDLLLCAYSGEVLGQMMRSHDEEVRRAREMTFGEFWRGRITAENMKAILSEVEGMSRVPDMIRRVRAGEAIALKGEHVDFYNSLQSFHATRYVVDPRGEFEVARGVMARRQPPGEDLDIAS